jgi:hypothetical protein
VQASYHSSSAIKERTGGPAPVVDRCHTNGEPASPRKARDQNDSDGAGTPGHVTQHVGGVGRRAGAAGANDRPGLRLVNGPPTEPMCALPLPLPRRSPVRNPACRSAAEAGRGLWLVTSRASSPRRWVAAACTKSPVRPLSRPRGRGCAAVAAMCPRRVPRRHHRRRVRRRWLLWRPVGPWEGGRRACVLVLLRVRRVSADLCDDGPVHLAYNPSYSACFFSRNNIFLSQKISKQCFSAGL